MKTVELQLTAYEKPTIEVVKFSLEEGIAVSGLGHGITWFEEDDC